MADGPKLTIETSYDPCTGAIEQVLFEQFEHHRVMWMRQQINTADARIREALVALGWTPPPGSAQTQESKP